VKLRRTLPDGTMRSQPFGKPIYDNEEVEGRIRRAQLAILNPSKDPQFYLNASEDWEFDLPELGFSGDCVSLEISGPDVADLSFCDLPGAFYHSHSSHETKVLLFHRIDRNRRSKRCQERY
jgi:hypothetical protein